MNTILFSVLLGAVIALICFGVLHLFMRKNVLYNVMDAFFFALTLGVVLVFISAVSLDSIVWHNGEVVILSTESVTIGESAFTDTADNNYYSLDGKVSSIDGSDIYFCDTETVCLMTYYKTYGILNSTQSKILLIPLESGE